MKKVAKYLLLAFIIIFTTTIILLGKYYNAEKLSLDENNQNYKLIYNKNDIVIDSLLSSEESNRLFTIFNGKKKFKEDLSCGFDDTMMFNLGDVNVLIASDGDPYFYIKEENRYI